MTKYARNTARTHAAQFASHIMRCVPGALYEPFPCVLRIDEIKGNLIHYLRTVKEVVRRNDAIQYGNTKQHFPVLKGLRPRSARTTLCGRGF